MSEKLKYLLKKTFVDSDIKLEVLNVQETNLRHTVASNTVFDHPSKWLLEEELENQCIDWVYQFLLSKEFPESWAAKISYLTCRLVMSDISKMDKLITNEGGAKRISTDQFEDVVADMFQNFCRDLHSQLNNNNKVNKGDVDIVLGKILQTEDACDLVKEVSVHAIKNTRRKMEDKHVILKHFSEMFGLPAGYSFYAVLDGHGGIDAARFSSTHLSGTLSKHLPHLTTVDKNKPAAAQNRSPIKSQESPITKGLLIPQLPKEDRKSFDSIKASIVKEETCQPKLKRNSYHESDTNRKVPGSNPGRDGNDGVRRALERSIIETNRIFCEKAKMENNSSGCTAICLLMEGGCRRKFHVAWVGDSQAMLVRGGRPVEVMVPHKPEREDEKERITALGGSVVHFGTWRVNGTISVSRAIGDIGHKPYISSQPDVTSFAVQSDDEYLVLACDGLWDVLSCDDVINLVTNHVEVEKMERRTVAQALVMAAKDKGSSDNITAIVIFLKDDINAASTSQPSKGEPQIPDGNSRSTDGESDGNKGDHGKSSENKKEGKSDATKSDQSSGEISKLSLKTGHLFDATSSKSESKTTIGNSPTSGQNDDENESETHLFEIRTCCSSNDTRGDKIEKQKNDTLESTNNDSKENYLASSAELPLEFSPLRSEVKAENEVGSLASARSRIKRSPKISSSTTEDKEDKENIDLKMCLKPDATPSTCSDSIADVSDVGRKSSKSSIKMQIRQLKLYPVVKRELKETNADMKKDNIPTQATKDSIQLVRAVPLNVHKQHPTNLQPPTNKGVTQPPSKHPFSSTSSVSVGFLRDSGRKFSQTSSHLKKLDLTPTSFRPMSNFGSCGLSEQPGVCWPGRRERWAVAIETGEDLEGMFECEGGLNVSSSRW